MSLLATLLDTSLGGGLIGGIGGLIQGGIAAYTQTKQLAIQKEMQKETLAHERAKWVVDTEMTKLELAHKLELAEMDMKKELTEADLKAMTESMSYDKRTYTTDAGAEKFAGWFVLVDVWRGIMRPSITAYYSTLFGIFGAWITFVLFTQYPEALTKEWIVVNFKDVIQALIFITTTVTLWWFAARASQSRTAK